MKNIVFICVLFFTGILFSQNNGVVKGHVSDAALKNEPMLFANIQLKGTDTSYQTNFHGNFEIENLTPGSHTLIISYAGYKTQEINLVINKNSISTIETILSPMQISIDAVEGMDTAKKPHTNPSDS